jgi:hypothetical protein
MVPARTKARFFSFDTQGSFSSVVDHVWFVDLGVEEMEKEVWYLPHK